MMAQNTSNAVMASRVEPADSPDDFPTPPWATRALCELISHIDNRPTYMCSVWEPASGRGHMVRALSEKFRQVISSDKFSYPYGPGTIRDFLDPSPYPVTDWIITNPPFVHAEKFALAAIERAFVGVALLVRLNFIETIGRRRRLFLPHPPTIIAPFVERVPMFRGRCSAKGSTATAYAWIIWLKGAHGGPTQLVWIDPCRKRLENRSDYDG